MKLRFIISILFLLSFQQAKTQSREYAGEILNEICSENYHGRGYAAGGADKTADFILKKLKKSGLKKFGKSYFQPFNIKVNTFFGENELTINGKNLKPGIDYIISASSNSITGTFKIARINAELINNPQKFKTFIDSDFSDKVIVIDTFSLHRPSFDEAYRLITEKNILKAKAIIKLTDKNLTYVPSKTQKKFPVFILKKSRYSENSKTVFINLENKYYKNFETKNIIAYIKGKSDTSIVFSAHYDHLGTMGKDVFFPGANDNGSGVAMLLNLAKYFSGQKKPKYNIVFMFFSGEELGLLGSYYYVRHPLFPLSKIKFMINLDMVGSGDKGIKIVNGSVFRQEFDTLTAINEKNNYLPAVKIRGKAANSDHYFFFEKGVPVFFIYTLGNYKEYHNIFDTPENLPLNKFEELMHLLIDFVNYLQNDKKSDTQKQDLQTVQRNN